MHTSLCLPPRPRFEQLRNAYNALGESESLYNTLSLTHLHYARLSGKCASPPMKSHEQPIVSSVGEYITYRLLSWLLHSHGFALGPWAHGAREIWSYFMLQ